LKSKHVFIMFDFGPTQAVLGALKRVAAADNSPVSSSQAVGELLRRGVGVAIACIPCSHRAVALAASSCMVAILGESPQNHTGDAPSSQPIVAGVFPKKCGCLGVGFPNPKSFTRK